MLYGIWDLETKSDLQNEIRFLLWIDPQMPYNIVTSDYKVPQMPYNIVTSDYKIPQMPYNSVASDYKQLLLYRVSMDMCQ